MWLSRLFIWSGPDLGWLCPSEREHLETALEGKQDRSPPQAQKELTFQQPVRPYICAAGAAAVGTLWWQPGTLTPSIKITCTWLRASSVESPQAIRAAAFWLLFQLFHFPCPSLYILEAISQYLFFSSLSCIWLIRVALIPSNNLGRT